jgi:hypothetical protein
LTLVTFMFAAWAASLLFVFVLKFYSASLSRNEDDQIALSQSSINLQSEQAAIAGRVQKLEPFKKMSYVLLGLLTLSVIIYFAFDIYRQFN